MTYLPWTTTPCDGVSPRCTLPTERPRQFSLATASSPSPLSIWPAHRNWSRYRLSSACRCYTPGHAAGWRVWSAAKRWTCQHGQHITENTLSALHQGETAPHSRRPHPGRSHHPGGPPAHLKALEAYGEALGLLFQVTDDLLDATGDTATLGKPSPLGRPPMYRSWVPGAEARADRLLEAGLEALSPSPQGDRLAAALHWVRNRRF